MKLSEFARRARTSRLQKKAKFEAAFERAKRDLKLPEVSAMRSSPRPLQHTYIRSEAPRPILTLFPRGETAAAPGDGE